MLLIIFTKIGIVFEGCNLGSSERIKFDVFLHKKTIIWGAAAAMSAILRTFAVQ